jgi:hypothetical protein
VRGSAVVLLASVVLVAGCGSSHSEVPDVRFKDFPNALGTLHGDGYLVRVPYFPPIHRSFPEQGYGTLSDYIVADESPSPGTHAHHGATVTLLVSLKRFEGPLGSIVEPNKVPPRSRVPNLVGRTYASAIAGPKTWDGLWRRVEWVAPLTAGASTAGLGAFLVSRQRPAGGLSVPFGGIQPGKDGVWPRVSTLTIDLGDVRAARRADASAQRALAAAHGTPTYRRIGSRDFRWYGRPAPPGAGMFHCELGRARAAGRCFTAVDPRGSHPIVAFAETWRQRSERGTATGPLRSRTWRARL